MSTTPNKWFTSYTKQSKPLLIKGDIGYGKTFIINETGKIIYKFMGPLTKEIITNEIKPLL